MTWREEQIGDCRLILGDCRDMLPTLGGVHAVITDPPYGVGKATWDIFDAELLGKVVHHAQQWQAICLLYGAMSRLPDLFGLHPDRLLFCCKDYVQIRPCALHYATDPIAVWFHGWKRRPTPRDWFTITTADTSRIPRSGHPTEKPLRALTYLVQTFSDPGAMVCDPFFGSGTTAAACVVLGRKFIGCEQNPHYFDLACRRIEAAYKQGDLFRPAPPVAPPTQPALFGAEGRRP